MGAHARSVWRQVSRKDIEVHGYSKVRTPDESNGPPQVLPIPEELDLDDRCFTSAHSPAILPAGLWRMDAYVHKRVIVKVQLPETLRKFGGSSHRRRLTSS